MCVRETDIQTERSRDREAGCLVLSPRPGEREAGRQGHRPNDVRRRPRHHPRPGPGYHGDPGDRVVVSLKGVFVYIVYIVYIVYAAARGAATVVP